MSFLIQQWEPTAVRRRVPFRLFTSNGTSPDTNASDGTVLLTINGAAQISGGSISVISANAGMYYAEPSASNVSVLGSVAVYTDTIATDFPQHVATIQVVNFDPFGDTLASSNSRLQGGTVSSLTLGSGETTRDGWFNGATVILKFANGDVIANEISVYTGNGTLCSLKNPLPFAPPSSTTYFIIPGTYNDLSTQSVRGVNNFSNLSGSFSGLTVQGLSNYANISNVTLHAGTHSNVTIQGVTRVNSGVTLNADTHSGATIQGVTRLNSNVTLNANTHSGATIQGVSNPANIIASHLSYDLGNSRLVQDAYHMIRNRKDVAADGSSVTFYLTDDTTVLFDASATSGAAPLRSMNPLP
jgi:hypothetical protein